jgi:hypothetical protein
MGDAVAKGEASLLQAGAVCVEALGAEACSAVEALSGQLGGSLGCTYEELMR